MMMKWGRRKASSSSASKHSFSPISWLSKLKQKGGDSERKPAKGKGKEERNSDSPSFSWPPESWNDGRFCGGDDDSFWRISFGEERFEGETSRVGLRSVCYGSDDQVEEVPMFSSKKYCKPKETPKFNEMVLDIRKMRELNRNSENLPEIVTCKGEKAREGKEFKMPRRRKAAKDKKSNRREMERELDKEKEKLMVDEEKDIFELEPTKKIQTTEGTLLRTIEEDYVFEALNMEKNTNGFSEEAMKIKELMSNIEKERKSIYINRELQRRKQNGKVKVSFPRTVTKIKAIEDMKRAKLKKKKKKERTAFDNFAMVKCSYNPEQDFRDSMVEMIREKRIRRPEELEELLACYLTLNSDEYHDLIIKVFRQVWFDLE